MAGHEVMTGELFRKIKKPQACKKCRKVCKGCEHFFASERWIKSRRFI